MACFINVSIPQKNSLPAFVCSLHPVMSPGTHPVISEFDHFLALPLTTEPSSYPPEGFLSPDPLALLP